MIRGPELSDSSGLYELIQEHAGFEKSAAPLTVIVSDISAHETELA